jgi:hypothetical protein
MGLMMMLEYKDIKNNTYNVIQTIRTPNSDEEREYIKENILNDLYNIFASKKKAS